MAYSCDSSGSGWCRRKKFRPHWSHVRMPCIFIGCFIDQAQLDSHDGRTQWGICLARRKISNVWFFPHASQGQFLTKSSPHTVRKRLSKPPREAVCSALSSPCAAGFSGRQWEHRKLSTKSVRDMDRAKPCKPCWSWHKATVKSAVLGQPYLHWFIYEGFERSLIKCQRCCPRACYLKKR